MRARSASTTAAPPLPDWPDAGVKDFIVSFPKSGRTWLRVLLAAALALHRTQDLAKMVGGWLDHDLIDLDGRTLQFTHALSNRFELPGTDMQRCADFLAGKRTLLLMRDPRDTVVSYFFQRTRRRGNVPPEIPRDISSFARHPSLGVDRIIDFLNIWWNAATSRRAVEDGSALVLAYENLHHMPHELLRQCLSFFGVKLSDDSILDKAVEFASFQNMRQMEAGEHFVTTRKLRPADRNDAESFKTRQGKVGGYVQYFSAADAEWIEQRIHTRLNPAVGYRSAGIPGNFGNPTKT